jgi:hypothetical protein
MLFGNFDFTSLTIQATTTPGPVSCSAPSDDPAFGKIKTCQFNPFSCENSLTITGVANVFP